MKSLYKTLEYEKEIELLKKLTTEKAALKAIQDAGIKFKGEAPEVVYKLILDRLIRSESIID